MDDVQALRAIRASIEALNGLMESSVQEIDEMNCVYRRIIQQNDKWKRILQLEDDDCRKRKLPND